MEQKVRFSIEGMTCQACANRIEKVLGKKDFVSAVGVNFASEEAQVSFDDSRASVEEIQAIIQKTGFKATLPSEDSPALASETQLGWRLWLLIAINIPFLIGMVGMLIGQHHWMIAPKLQFALASVVQLWLAIPFYKGAIASIKGGLANMDVLVSLGTLAVYLYSTYLLFSHSSTAHGEAHVYFEVGVMVVGFVSFGKFLEERAKKQSLNSLGMLLQLTPKQVNVQRNEQWQTVPLDQVAVGELIRANHGERVAADGVVESGNAWADESHLTGESQPQQKESGSPVLAGAMITDGSVIYRAEQLGSHTLLGDMMSALSEAQGSKAPIARIADKVAGVFVPTVVGIALLTFIITWFVTSTGAQALMHAVAVLVIACPCALGLATPAAIMVGMGKAVNHGIWFKDAPAMERASKVDTVVLDKTGTLTEGKPKLVAVWLPENSQYSEDDVLRAAAAVEMTATHPLANAIVNHAFNKGLEVAEAIDAKTEAGQGVYATVPDLGLVKVGKPDYCGVKLPENIDDIWRIASIVAVSINDQPAGAFALADALKSDTAAAIERLKSHNIDIYVMSGDHQSVVEYIAAQLGIAHAFGNMSPRDKATEVQKLKDSGKVVAMVGDGINDAPALAAADVSFAMKGGADVAEHTASATLMQHSVNQMVDALMIARATVKNIKQNLFFAFIYNILGIPLAAFGFLTPVIAGAAMALSSISVLSNAMRLKKVKID